MHNNIKALKYNCGKNKWKPEVCILCKHGFYYLEFIYFVWFLTQINLQSNKDNT